VLLMLSITSCMQKKVIRRGKGKKALEVIKGTPIDLTTASGGAGWKICHIDESTSSFQKN
jgi:hypothetical protein